MNLLIRIRTVYDSIDFKRPLAFLEELSNLFINRKIGMQTVFDFVILCRLTAKKGSAVETADR